MALVKDRSTDQECGNEEEWIKLMDRGGLWYLKETTCSFQLRKKLENPSRCCHFRLTNVRKNN